MIESIPLDNNGKELKGSKGAEGREYINLLFRLEEEMAGMSAEERKKKRQTASRMLLDVLWTWVEKCIRPLSAAIRAAFSGQTGPY